MQSVDFKKILCFWCTATNASSLKYNLFYLSEVTKGLRISHCQGYCWSHQNLWLHGIRRPGFIRVSCLHLTGRQFHVCCLRQKEIKKQGRTHTHNHNILCAIVKRHNSSNWRSVYTQKKTSRWTRATDEDASVKQKRRPTQRIAVQRPYFISLIWGCIKLDHSNLSLGCLHRILTFYCHRNVVHFVLTKHMLQRHTPQCFQQKKKTQGNQCRSEFWKFLCLLFQRTPGRWQHAQHNETSLGQKW